jgi:hypothetical protein
VNNSTLPGSPHSDWTTAAASPSLPHLTGEWTRYLLPLSLQREAFFLAHSAPLAVHNGMEATVARVATFFLWPTVQRDIRLMVQNCPDCVQKITKERLKAGIHVPSRQGYPQQVLFIHLVGPGRKPVYPDLQG